MPNFELLYMKHHESIRRYVTRRYSGDINDVVDEVFLIAWTKRELLPVNEAQLAAWLFGAARRVIANKVRWQARLDRFSSLAEPLAPTEAPSSRECDLAVHEALRQLREGDRELLLLVEWEGLSVESAADALGLPVTTVTKRLRAARERFRRAFAMASQSVAG
jgi:RNA polymerase sigma-70 factor, ECF subfamily